MSCPTGGAEHLGHGLVEVTIRVQLPGGLAWVPSAPQHRVQDVEGDKFGRAPTVLVGKSLVLPPGD
jgi:hypothetical protein